MALSSAALCTLGGSGEGIKDELGISGSSEDTRLELFIEAASEMISDYCGAPSFHYEAARVEDHRGYGTALLHVEKRPLLSIGSVVYDPQDTNQTIDSSEYLVDSESEGRVYRSSGWQWTASEGRAIGTHYLPGTEESLYRVTFECGYKTRNQVDNLGVSGSMSLPYALERAALMLASMLYRWSPRNPDVKSERLLGWAASYGANGQALPPTVAVLVSPYKRPVWA